MSSRAWTERVQDILDAIVEIQAFTLGTDFDAFRGDIKTIKAVELDFVVIGEAASHIPDDVQTAHPEVPWHLMRAMRNRLVHVYFSVDPKIVWETLKNDLPPLLEPLRRLVREQQAQGHKRDTTEQG